MNDDYQEQENLSGAFDEEEYKEEQKEQEE